MKFIYVYSMTLLSFQNRFGERQRFLSVHDLSGCCDGCKFTRSCHSKYQTTICIHLTLLFYTSNPTVLELSFTSELNVGLGSQFFTQVSDAVETYEIHSYYFQSSKFCLITVSKFHIQVILMVAGAIHVVVGGGLYWLWLAASIGAAVFYMLVCFRCKTEAQITVAGYMSTFYAILMLAVTVGKSDTCVTMA